MTTPLPLPASPRSAHESTSQRSAEDLAEHPNRELWDQTGLSAELCSAAHPTCHLEQRTQPSLSLSPGGPGMDPGSAIVSPLHS